MGEAGGIGFTDDFSFMVTVVGRSCVFDMWDIHKIVCDVVAPKVVIVLNRTIK